MNLYPFNYYILLISAILVIIFLLITIFHLNTLGKTLLNENQSFDNIKKQIGLFNYKKNAIIKKHQDDHKNDKYLKAMLPILFAVYNTYKDDDTLKGIKGYKKATSKVLKSKLKNKTKVR
jgi:hypothetical protein